MEEKIQFRSTDLLLEGLFEKKSNKRAVVVLHPHPLYGGEMSNPVVESLVTAYGRKGWSTLRFNFRGVGRSQGSYDNGEGERRDVLAAIKYLLAQGLDAIHLAGYSFGSWVQAGISQLPEQVLAQIMVSPPIALLPLPEDLSVPRLRLVVIGEDDEFAPVQLVQEALKVWNSAADLEVISQADHFYFGCFRELERLVATAIND